MNTRISFLIFILAVFLCNHQFNAFRVREDFSWPGTSHTGEAWNVLRRHLFQNSPSKKKPKPPDTTERISNGLLAAEGRHPYMCAIYTSGSSFEFQCGGFLIHPRWVMTAAHCVSPETPAHNAVVVCGIYRDADIFDAREATFAVKTYIPKEYDHDRVKEGNDIALLELEDPYNDLAVPILDLGYTCGFLEGSNFSAVGFGYESANGAVSEVLQHAPQLDFVPLKRCRNDYYNYIGPGQICAGTGRQDTCKGDSGGPLFIPHTVGGKYENGDPAKDVIIGIVSVGPKMCGAGEGPGIYTSINAHSGWIIDTTMQDVRARAPVCLASNSKLPSCEIDGKRQKALRSRFKTKPTAAKIAALMRAIPKDDCNLVEVMMDLGVNANKTVEELSFLHYAVSSNATATANILIDHGADLEAEDPDGNTPLQYATYGGNLTMVQLLLDRKADPDSQNDEGYSAIHRAALNGHYDIVKALIKANADIDLRIKDGSTALHLAARNGHYRVVKLLVGKGANVKAKNKSGKTPKDNICRIPCTSKQRTLTTKYLS